MVKYANLNKDLFSRCISRLKTWSKGVLEANEGAICWICVVTTVKSKKRIIKQIKYRVTILLNSVDIEEVNYITSNNF